VEKIALEQAGVWLPADIQTPISLFLGLVGAQPGMLLESAEVDGRLGRYSVIGWDYRLVLTCRNGRLGVSTTDRRLAPLVALDGAPFVEGLRRVLRGLEIRPSGCFSGLPPLTRGLYGYLGYGLAGLFEPKLAARLPPEDAECCLVLPGQLALYDHLHHRCCYLSLAEEQLPGREMSSKARALVPPRVGTITNSPDEETFKAGVRKARTLITNGDAIQTVLSTRYAASFAGDPFVLYRRLRQVNPSPYMFFMELPELTLIGSSPELLVRCRDGALQVRPIAGTRPRGGSEAEDLALAEELHADPKERAEHVMLVDLGRNDLGRIAQPGSVRVDSFMQVERYSHVMHLTSNVQARLADGLDALDVLASTFPAGTVSGAPKVRAMEIIADIEPASRGPYAGAIGWIRTGSGTVDLDTGITIRSLWVRDGQVGFQAGAGIVYDSDPDKEWQECQNKARVVKEVLSNSEEGDVFAQATAHRLTPQPSVQPGRKSTMARQGVAP